MYKQIGTKVYYCLLTGNVIKIIGDMVGCVKETSFDEDIEIYTDLKERNKSSIGLLTFEYGEYIELSKDATDVIVDLKTKELIFSYEELPTIPVEPTWEEEMEKKISILECENENLKQELALTQDAVNEMLFMMMNIKGE